MRTNPSHPPIVDPQPIPKPATNKTSANIRGRAGGADNLTTAIDSYPEHPKIKRTRTPGLPNLLPQSPPAPAGGTADRKIVLSKGARSRSGLGSGPPRLDDGPTGHGPGLVPTRPCLPLPLEHRGVRKNVQNAPFSLVGHDQQTTKAKPSSINHKRHKNTEQIRTYAGATLWPRSGKVCVHFIPPTVTPPHFVPKHARVWHWLVNLSFYRFRVE